MLLSVSIYIGTNNVHGKVILGEITFYPKSGLGVFKPKKYNNILGDMITLPSEINRL